MNTIITAYINTSSDWHMEVKKMIGCTRKAWNLVKGRVYTHGKFNHMILSKILILLHFMFDYILHKFYVRL